MKYGIEFMKDAERVRSALPKIEQQLGYLFKDKELLLRAFVHRSFFHEHSYDVDGHNERLEFLGDSVLGLMVSDFLFKRFPTRPEGELSHIRAHLVDSLTCKRFVQMLELDQYILLGKGEQLNVRRGRDGLFGDLFEALIGALYLDGGLEAAWTFFFSHFQGELDRLVEMPMRNWKAELQDFAQKMRRITPVYKVLQEVGPDHGKQFLVGAYIGERCVGEGMGSSKKEAETLAAQKAIEALGL